MKTKERMYAAIGGCVGAVLTMIVCSFFPLGVQSHGNRFGEITCTGLKVVGSDGSVGVELGYMGTDSHGGWVWVTDRTGKMSVAMTTHEEGGRVDVRGKGDSKGGGTFTVDNDGGLLILVGSEGEGSNKGMVTLGINQHGGRVDVLATGEDAGQAYMGVGEYGGIVNVVGKGSSKGRAVVGMSEFGNGVVSTWDKNGYRLANLK